MSSDTSPVPTNNLRRNLLLAVLALLTVGLLYDFAVARPAVEEAYAVLTKTNAEFNIARRHRAMGVADVRDLIGREPSRTFEDRELHVEVYSWRSGLPFRTHDLFVVYRTVLGEKYLVRLTKFGHEAEDGFNALQADEPGQETRPFVPPTAAAMQPSSPESEDGFVPEDGGAREDGKVSTKGVAEQHEVEAVAVAENVEPSDAETP